MSAVEGWAFVVIRGPRFRCSATSAGSWPAVASQQAVTAWQASWNGAVRPAARTVGCGRSWWTWS